MNSLKTSKYILLGFLLSSCSDLLDLEPPMTQVEENFYRDESDATQALTAVYNVLNWSAPNTASGSPQNCAFELVSEVLSDACYAGGANANDIPSTVRLSRFTTLVTDPAPEALWNKYWSGIYRANKFFSCIDDVPFKEEYLKLRMKAEASFLRANYYFDLVRLFGNIPLILTPLTPADYSQTQVAPEVIYAQIAKDLLYAIQTTDESGDPVLPLSSLQIESESKGHVSKAAAESLLARVWLYYTGYYGQASLPGVSSADMLTYLDDVVYTSGHSLMQNAYDRNVVDQTGSCPLFAVANKNNSESVFEIQYTDLSKWGDWGNRQGCLGNQAVILWGMRDVGGIYASGWSFAPVNKVLFDRFSSSDPRRYATFINANPNVGDNDGEGLKYTPGYQNTGIFNRKFTPLTANNARYGGSRELNYRNNYPLIRFADVLLMHAEMNLLYGDKIKAFESYKQVRERAMGVGSVQISASQLTLDMIDNERIYELSMEGHRYWDLLRRGQDYAESYLSNGQRNEFAVTYDRKRAGLLPIPEFDIRQSKNSLKQNPGY